MKHLCVYFLFIFVGLSLLNAQNIFSQELDASGQWTYSINTQTRDCFPFPVVADAGSYLINQSGTAVTVINETYDKTYLGSATDEGNRIKYDVESVYSYFGGTMSETLIFYIYHVPVDNQTVATGTAGWQWVDLSGNATCATVNGTFNLSMTKHQKPGACYEDFGTKYCCTVDNSGTEYCCHTGEHLVLQPGGIWGSPELEHCCYYDDNSSLEYCSYVISDTRYKWNYSDGGGATTITVCPTTSPSAIFPALCSVSGAMGNTGALTGTVTTSDGKDITSTVNTFYSNGTIYKTTQTFGTGSSKDYFFGSLAVDNLYLKVTASGYNIHSSTFTIQTGETLVRNVVLTPLVLDGCPDDPYKSIPGTCGCGVPDTDSDNDGTADCVDLCPNDPDKVAPGCNMCGTPDTDADGDGTADCLDKCVTDPNKVHPGICGCGAPDEDTDGDGQPDCPMRIGPNIYLLLKKNK